MDRGKHSLQVEKPGARYPLLISKRSLGLCEATRTMKIKMCSVLAPFTLKVFYPFVPTDVPCRQLKSVYNIM